MTNGHNVDVSGDGHGRPGVDQDAAQREARVASREAACDARERDTALILRAAARRDTVAAQRDAAADRRDFDAAVHQWMHNQSEVDSSRARTEARKDRVASKNDRRAAEVDRTELAAPPEAPRPTGVTLEEAIASAVERIKASSQAIDRVD